MALARIPYGQEIVFVVNLLIICFLIRALTQDLDKKLLISIVVAAVVILVDTALASPFAQLAMIPMLALIARNAPPGNAATWFAVMASLMNLALTAGTLFSRYLNKLFVITREIRDHTGSVVTHANYSDLGILLITVSIIGLIIPLATIWLLMRKRATKKWGNQP